MNARDTVFSLTALLALAGVAEAQGWPQWRATATRAGLVEIPLRMDTPGVRWSRATGGTALDVVSADVDQDGQLEFLSIEAGKVVARRASGLVLWDSPAIFARRVVAVDDVDGDGAREVVVDAGRSAVLLDAESGALVWQSSLALPIESIGSFLVRDMAGGPGLEIVIADKAGNAGKPHLTGAAFVFSFDGGIGDDAPSAVTQAGTRDYESGRSIALGDVDGDGKLEIVAPGAKRLYAYDSQSGALLFESGPLPGLGSENLSQCVIEARDIDGDGRDELVLLTNAVFVTTPSRRVAMAELDGGALAWRWTLAPAVAAGTAHHWPSPAIMDADGDGAYEVVSALWTPLGWTTRILDAGTGTVEATLPGQRVVAQLAAGAGQVDLLAEQTPYQQPGPFEEKRVWRLTAGGPVVVRTFERSAVRVPDTPFVPGGTELLVITDSDGDDWADAVTLERYETGQVLREVGTEEALYGAQTVVLGGEPLLVLLYASGRLALFDDAFALQNDANGDGLPDLRFEGHYLHRVAALGSGEPLLLIPEAGGRLVALDPTQGTPFDEPPVHLAAGANMTQLPAALSLPGGPAVLLLSLDESRQLIARALWIGGGEAWTSVLGGAGGTLQLRGDPVVLDVNGDGFTDLLLALQDTAKGQTHEVRALCGVTGAPLWASPDLPTPGGGIGALSATENGELVLVVANRDLYALSAATGELSAVLTMPTGHYFGTPISVNLDEDPAAELLVVGTTRGALAYDHDLTLLWERDMGLGTLGLGAVIGSDAGPVVLASRAQSPRLDLLHGATGALIASTALVRGVAYADAALAPAEVAALAQVQDVLPARDLLGDGQDGFLVTSADGFLYALRKDATLAWAHDIGGALGSPAILDVDGDGTAEIAVPKLTGHLVLIDDTPVAATEWADDADPEGSTSGDVDQQEQPDVLRVRWAPVDGAGSYAVRVVSQFGTVIAQQLNTGPVTEWTFDGLSLQLGTKYTASVRALHASGGATVAGPEQASDGVVLVDLSPPQVTGTKSSSSVMSPDVPGLLGGTTISASLWDKTRLSFWSVVITGAGGPVLREWSGGLSARTHDVSVHWDGRDSAGAKVPAGKVTITVMAHDFAGHAAQQATSTHVVRLPTKSKANVKSILMGLLRLLAKLAGWR